jgi:predicted Zn-dependent protease
MRYMTKAGYNPTGMLHVMEVLKAAGGGGGQAEWLSTHPLPETRIQRINAALQTEPYASAAKNSNAVVGQAEFKRRFLDVIAKHPPPKPPAPAQPAQQQQQNVAPKKKK